jgi:hypothetical protein
MLQMKGAHEPPEIGSAESGLRGLGQLQKVVSVPALNLPGLAFMFEPFQAVLADGLERLEAVGPYPGFAAADQAGFDQGLDAVQHADLERSVRIAHGLRCLDGEAAGEHAEASKLRRPGRRQQAIAPFDGVTQRSLPVRQVARPAGEQGKGAIQPFEHRHRREHPEPGRRKLDGQGKPVEATADLDDGACVALVDGEPRIDRRGPLGKQGNGLEPVEVARRDGFGSQRQIKRRHRNLPLAPESERGSARG